MTTSSAALIEARGLTVRFGTITALDGLDLSAPAGQVLAVLGPNGAGKTTLVRTIATLVQPTSGDLCVLGHHVADQASQVRFDIGLAGQFAAVEPTMTGRENLEMTARLFGHGRRAAAAAAQAVINQLDLGEVAERRCSTYSGGQKRRLDLGASLVGAPRLLLLDEPTTGLDPMSRREVWDAVRRLVAGGTDVLLTTHYLDEANELADQVVIIDHGRAVASGTLADLKASVGRDVIDMAVVDPDAATAAARVLEDVTSTPARIDGVNRRISAVCSGGPTQLAATITRLDQTRIAVEEIGLRRPTLDEVFATLTASSTSSNASDSALQPAGLAATSTTRSTSAISSSGRIARP
jgi:ABC-2 type transport system ATP-binding protein